MIPLNHSSVAASPRRARGRRLRFCVILGIAQLVLLEGGAWLAFLILDGRAFTYSRLSNERTRRGIWARNKEEAARVLDLKNQPGAIHPYLGYVRDVDEPTWKRTQRAITRIEELGLDPPRRAPGELLVGIFGGSVADLFLDNGTARLERALEEGGALRGRKVRFIGAALGGWKQPQQLFALTWLLSLGGELDIAISLDGFNEVALHEPENGRQGIFPAYPRLWSSRVERVPDPTTRMALGRFELANASRERWSRTMERRPWRWSIAANLVWRARERLLNHDAQTAMELLRAPRAPIHSYSTQGPPFDGSDPARTMDELVALWERSSRLMNDLCRAHDIRYFHFLQPNQYVPGSKPLSAEELRDCVRFDSETLKIVGAGYPKLRETGRKLAESGETFVDLTQVFAGVTETLYVDAYCHFNQRGNEILADRIAAVITADLAHP